MIELWDDRCVQIMPNTGIMVQDALVREVQSMKNDDMKRRARIAELEAERNQLREVAEKLVWLYSDEHQGRLDNGLRIDGFYSHEWLGMILDMAREAMKGAEK